MIRLRVAVAVAVPTTSQRFLRHGRWVRRRQQGRGASPQVPEENVFPQQIVKHAEGHDGADVVSHQDVLLHRAGFVDGVQKKFVARRGVLEEILHPQPGIVCLLKELLQLRLELG